MSIEIVKTRGVYGQVDEHRKEISRLTEENSRLSDRLALIEKCYAIEKNLSDFYCAQLDLIIKIFDEKYIPPSSPDHSTAVILATKHMEAFKAQSVSTEPYRLQAGDRVRVRETSERYSYWTGDDSRIMEMSYIAEFPYGFTYSIRRIGDSLSSPDRDFKSDELELITKYQ